MTRPPPGPDGPPTPHRAERSGSGAGLVLALCVLGLPALAVFVVFLPLFLAVIEQAASGTARVRDFCYEIGIGEALGAIYTSILVRLGPYLAPLLG